MPELIKKYFVSGFKSRYPKAISSKYFVVDWIEELIFNAFAGSPTPIQFIITSILASF